MTTEKPSEFKLIEMIKESFEGIPHRGLEGIGDDCAIIPMGAMESGESMVITTDMLVEDIHFTRCATSAYMLGRKSLAVNFSDVAAMGAEPTCSLLALSLPKDVDSLWIREFMNGYHSLSSEFGVPLIGGDTTASKDRVTISVTAMGRLKNKNIKRRGDARVGDRLFVTGYLGASAQGLEDIQMRHKFEEFQLKSLALGADSSSMEESTLLLDKLLAGEPRPKRAEQNKHIKHTGEQREQFSTTLAMMAHNNPKPYVKEGAWLGGMVDVHAMMDVSDGIASDLQHILKASSVGAEVEINKIPTNTNIEKALCGGEDYVLLLSVAPGEATNVALQYRAKFGEELHEIGLITEGDPKIKWLQGGIPIASDWHGFEHF